MDEKRVIKINNEEYVIEVYYERRNSSRASITSKGIYIRIPRLIPPMMREHEIQKLIDWVTNKIKSKPNVVKQAKSYYNDSYIKTNSKIYQIKIEMRDSIKNFCKVTGGIINFKISHNYGEASRQRYISKQLQKILSKLHHGELVSRVHQLNNLHFKQTLGKISFKYTTSRWGACKHNTHEINISTRLLLAPQEIMDYVIIHELAHLIEPSHNDKFWSLVKSKETNYKERIRWLKHNGNTLNI
jgi:predicted metal-dependent hydrolase